MTLAVNKTQEQSMEPVNVGGRLMGSFKQRVDETITYLIDYSKWLADNETVSSAAFYISPSTTPAGEVVGSTVQDGNQVLFQFDNGIDGQKYIVTVEATTSSGQIKVDYFTISIGTPSKEAAFTTVETAVTASQAARHGAETAQAGAVAARTGAEAARTGAQAAQTGAEAALAGIGTSLTQAQAARTGSETARDAAITAKTAAETAKTGAEAAQAGVAVARDAALAAQAAAETAKTGAETARTGAQSARTGAESAQAAATSSASDAATSATSAAGNASTATTKAGEAATSATNAASSASTATTKASDAATSATNAASSASTATTKASEAATSASNAATSATNSSNSATAAAAARTAAESARDATLAAYDSFDDRYLGVKSSDPTLDNDGNALVGGTLYFSSTDNAMKVYTGSAWVAAYVSGAGTLLAANNLSDLSSQSQARTNLGLGNSATKNTGTAAGTVAAGDDSRITGAAQKSANLGDLADAPSARTNLGLGTAATHASGDFAAAAHGHAISDISGLQTALDGKAAIFHTHVAADITNSTAAGRAILTAADAAAQRTALGLGSAATQSTSQIATTVLAAIPDPVAMALVFGS